MSALIREAGLVTAGMALTVASTKILYKIALKTLDAEQRSLAVTAGVAGLSLAGLVAGGTLICYCEQLTAPKKRTRSVYFDAQDKLCH